MGLTSASTGRKLLDQTKLHAKDTHLLVLAGSPNVGKSTVFNALTGLDQLTGNWTGKTVSTAVGRVDFEGCINELLAQGVRIFTCEFWYDGKSDPLEYITRNKNYVEKIFAGNR